MNKKIVALLIMSTFLVACKGGSNDSISNNNPQDPVKDEIVIIPESEVIFQKASDGYTYNEPMPIQDDWIIKESNGDIPATIDESKLTSSWYVPGDYTEFQKVKQTGEFSYLGTVSKIESGAHIIILNNHTKKEVFGYLNEILDIEFVISKDESGEEWYKIFFTGTTLEKVREEEKKLIFSDKNGKLYEYSSINPLFGEVHYDFKTNSDFLKKFKDTIDNIFEGK